MKELIFYFRRNIRFSKFRFADDEWFSMGERDFLNGRMVHDKLYHFIRDFLLTAFLYVIFSSFEASFFFAVLFNFLWEIKDGFMNVSNVDSDVDEFFRYFYGDGFSWKDFLAGLFGSLFLWFLGFYVTEFVVSNKIAFFLIMILVAAFIRWLYILILAFFLKNKF